LANLVRHIQGGIVSKLKNIPRVVWLVIGVLVTLLVIPSTAYAAALKFAGIEGTSTNRADVTAAQQLLSTEAQPANYYSDGHGGFDGSDHPGLLAEPGSKDALIVKSVHLSSFTSTSGYWSATIYIGNPSCGSEFAVVDTANGKGPMQTMWPYEPGISIPAGDALCGLGSGVANFFTSVTGYQVPAFAVAALAGPTQPAAAIQQRTDGLSTP
jgi:hypothetical protein